MNKINNLKNKVKSFFLMEVEGIGVVEIVLILVILVGLIVIFKEQITAIVNNTLKSIKLKTDSINR